MTIPGLILGLRTANERRRYFVTPFLIGWAQAKNQHWIIYDITNMRSWPKFGKKSIDLL